MRHYHKAYLQMIFLNSVFNMSPRSIKILCNFPLKIVCGMGFESRLFYLLITLFTNHLATRHLANIDKHKTKNFASILYVYITLHL